MRSSSRSARLKRPFSNRPQICVKIPHAVQFVLISPRLAEDAGDLEQRLQLLGTLEQISLMLPEGLYFSDELGFS